METGIDPAVRDPEPAFQKADDEDPRSSPGSRSDRVDEYKEQQRKEDAKRVAKRRSTRSGWHAVKNVAQSEESDRRLLQLDGAVPSPARKEAQALEER